MSNFDRDMEGLIFALKHPRYFLLSSAVILSICLISIFLAPTFQTLISSGTAGTKLSSFGIIYWALVFSITGPILWFFSIINSGKFDNLVEKVNTAPSSTLFFNVVGKIITVIFIVLLFFVSTTFISVDSNKITHYFCLMKTNEVSFDSIKSLSAEYSYGGNVAIYFHTDKNANELFFANGAGYEKNPYTDNQVRVIILNLNNRIKQLNLINSFTYASNDDASNVVKSYIEKFGGNFTINIQKN